MQPGSCHIDEVTAGGLPPVLVGLALGTAGGIPMYVWLGTFEVAAAGFLITAMAGWLAAMSHNASLLHGELMSELRSLSINRASQRIWRLLISPTFWWSACFGGVVVCTSVYYAGLRPLALVGGVGALWAVLAVCLNWSMTLIRPSSRCRRCGYDLTGQLRTTAGLAAIPCPECGTRWHRSQITGEQTPPLRKAA